MISRDAKTAIVNAAARLVPTKLARIKANQKTNRAIAREYGDLNSGVNWKSSSIHGIGNESSQVFGMVVRTIQSIDAPLQPVLLAGEAQAAKPVYASIAGVAADRIITAGLHDDADHRWNFEESPPDIGPFQCIVSHAILEHLINPYGHMRDLAGLLAKGGNLVVFTVTPGFPYHRHPIDCMRFFPDWFETVANRTALEVEDRYFGSERIMYRFRKL